MRTRYRILTLDKLGEFAIRGAEDRDIGREIVAIDQFELEEYELGMRRIEIEAVPEFAGSGFAICARGVSGKGK